MQTNVTLPDHPIEIPLSIKQTLRYPFTGNWKHRIGIGGILTMTSGFILPFIVLIGYYVTVIEAIHNNEHTAPAFKLRKAKQYLRDGTTLTAIALTYITTATILALTTSTIILLAVTLPETIEALTATEQFGILTAAFLIATITFTGLYTLPAVFTQYATHDSWKAAFDLHAIARTVTTQHYAMTLITGTGVFLTIALVGTATISIPVIGIVLAPFITFPATLMMYRAIATSTPAHLR